MTLVTPSVTPSDADALLNALSSGDPDRLTALLDRGVDLHDRSFDPLIRASFGRDVFRDERLIDLLRLLVLHGAELNHVTSYQESGVRMLSRIGRFDAVRLLLEAGADETPLSWTPLIRATAIGTIAEMQAAIDSGAPLEDREWWSRTAWLVALQVGDLGKAHLLLERGADVRVVGRCQHPPLFYAIECHRADMLRWLLAQGFDVEQTDKFGTTALIHAAECDNLDAIDVLLRSGAKIDRILNGGTALRYACSRAAVMRLLDVGADPQYLSDESRRMLLGLPADPDESTLGAVSAEQFLAARSRRFGSRNPELQNEPFWLAMIRAGVTGWCATTHFDGPSSFDAGPVWCAHRFGQSITFLPDGRIVQIAGEHEDSYDPDFCIYNDVFVHHPDGSIDIYGYPEAEFEPTDFHTATLCDDFIVIIGTLAYQRRETTPVYRLDTRAWTIERMTLSGEAPGWIHRHRADRVSPTRITVSGGEVRAMDGDQERTTRNAREYTLDVRDWAWIGAAPSS